MQHLESHVGARLDFLRSRREGDPPRHRSLRAVLDWSYRLLSPPLPPRERRLFRRLFRRLAGFRGGWTLENAAAICHAARRSKSPPLAKSAAGGLEMEALAIHERLRECSLIEAREVRGVTRFGFLETVREYAAEKLRASEPRTSRLALERRHAERFLELARKLGASQDGRGVGRLAAAPGA